MCMGSLEGKYKVSSTGCWVWTKAKGGRGYPRIRWNGATTGAHRVSWELANRKKIPKGLCVLHKCDTPLCINPEHLRTGTKKENGEEMSQRKRSTAGEKNRHAKLTQQQADEIKNSTEKTSVLVDRFGVCRATVKFIRAGKTWKG